MRTIVLCLALLGSTTAIAAPDRHPGHHVALSISPIHLVLPVAEVQAEIYLGTQLSAALIGGYGVVTAEVNNKDESFTVWEAGGQIRGYFYGTSTEGAFGALELLYTGVDTEIDTISGQADGLAVGAVAGYKWVWSSGFLFDLNGGISRVQMTAEAQDQSGNQENKTESKIMPVLNLNLGWAF